jgi:HK97 family phage prohead protease
MDDPDMNIGYVLSAEETEKGLEVLGQLDTGDDGSTKARQAYKLAKGRRATQWSFAYDVIDGGPVEADGQEFNELRELKLFEVSMTPIGANDQTELLAVKRATEAMAKAGRVLSSKNESTLRDAVSAMEAAASAIKSVLAAVESDDSGKASPASSASDTSPVKDEEPTGAKSEEPTWMPSVSTWETQINLSELEGDEHVYY